MNHRRSASLALLAAATAVLATACGSSGTTGSTPGAAGPATVAASGAAAPSASAPQTAGAAPVSSKGPGSAPTGATPPTGKPATGSGSNGGTSTGGSNATSDSYAWKHPCASGQVSIQVEYQQSIGSTRRIIVATNHGSAACGLSYYPTVSIADSRTIGSTSHAASFVIPKVPGGLGGAPYTSIHAGRSLYAVVDLDPGHTTSGAVRTYDELDVKASDFLPDADTTNHPLKAASSDSAEPYVKGPVLSLYQPSIADAVTQVGTLSNFK